MKNKSFGFFGIIFALLILSPLVGVAWLIDTYLFPPYWILIMACVLFAAFMLMLFVQYKTAISDDVAGGIWMAGFFASSGFLIAMSITTSVIVMYYLAKHFWM